MGSPVCDTKSDSVLHLFTSHEFTEDPGGATFRKKKIPLKHPLSDTWNIESGGDIQSGEIGCNLTLLSHPCVGFG